MDRLKPTTYLPSRAAKSTRPSQDQDPSASNTTPPLRPASASGPRPVSLASSSRPVSGIAVHARPTSSLAPSSRPVPSLAPSARPASSLAPNPRPVSGLAAISRPVPGLTASSRPAPGVVPKVAVTPASDEVSDAVDVPSLGPLGATDDPAPHQVSGTIVNPASNQVQDASVNPATDVVDNTASDQVQDTAGDATGDAVLNQAEANTTDRDLDVAGDSTSYQILDIADSTSDGASDAAEDPVPDQAPNAAANESAPTPASAPAPDTAHDGATTLPDAEQVNRAPSHSQDPPGVPEPVAVEVTAPTTAPSRGLEPTPVPEIDAATHIVVEHLRSGTVKTHVYSSKDGQPSLLGHVDPETIIDTISLTLDGKLQELNTLIRYSLEATRRESLDNTEALRAALEQNESHVANEVSLATNRSIEDQIRSEVVPRLDRIETLLTPSGGESGVSIQREATMGQPLDKGKGLATSSVIPGSDTPQSEDGDRGSHTSMEPMDPSVAEEPVETIRDQEATAGADANAAAGTTPALEPCGDTANPLILDKLTAMETQVDALYKVVVEGQIPQTTTTARDGGSGANDLGQADQEALERLNAMRNEILDFPESLKETAVRMQRLVDSLEANPAIAATTTTVPETAAQLETRDITEGVEENNAVDHENPATLEQWQAEYDDMMAALSDGLENRDLQFEALDAGLKNMEARFNNLAGVSKLNLRAHLRYMHMIYQRIDATDAHLHTALGDIQNMAEIAPERCAQILCEMDMMRNEVLSTLAHLPDAILNHLREEGAAANAPIEEVQGDEPVAQGSTGLGARTRDMLTAWATSLPRRSEAPTGAEDTQNEVRARAEPDGTQDVPEPSPTETDLERRVDFIEQHLRFNPARAAAGRSVNDAVPESVPADGPTSGDPMQRELAPELNLAQELDVIQRGLMSVADRQFTLQRGNERILELIEDQEQAEERRRTLDQTAVLPGLLETTDGLIKEIGDLRATTTVLGDRVVDCHNDVRNLLQGSMHDSDLLSAIKTHFETRGESRILTDELLKKAGDAFDKVENVQAAQQGTLAHQEVVERRLDQLQKSQDEGMDALIRKQEYSWLVLNDKYEKSYEVQLAILEKCGCRCRTTEQGPTGEAWGRSGPRDDVSNENPFDDPPLLRRGRERQARNVASDDNGCCSTCGHNMLGDNASGGNNAEVAELQRELEHCRAQQVMLAEEVKEADQTVGKLMVDVMDKDKDIDTLRSTMDEMRQEFERHQLAKDHETYNLKAKLDKKKQELKDMKQNMEWWLLEGLGLRPDPTAEPSGLRAVGAEPAVYTNDNVTNADDNNMANNSDGTRDQSTTQEGRVQHIPRHVLMTEAAAELRQTLEEHRMQVPGLLAEIRELEERREALARQVAQLEYQQRILTEAQTPGGDSSLQPRPETVVDAEGEDGPDDNEPWPQRTGRERLQTLRRNRNLSLSRARGQSCHRSQSRGPSGLNPMRGGAERVPQLEVDVKVCKDGDISETLFSNKAVLTQEQFDRVRANKSGEEEDDEVWSMFCDIKVRMVPFPPLIE